jgi:hypothetical protein
MMSSGPLGSFRNPWEPFHTAWVMGCPSECVRDATGVPQIAAGLLQCPARQRRATTGIMHRNEAERVPGKSLREQLEKRMISKWASNAVACPCFDIPQCRCIEDHNRPVFKTNPFTQGPRP